MKKYLSKILAIIGIITLVFSLGHANDSRLQNNKDIEKLIEEALLECGLLNATFDYEDYYELTNNKLVLKNVKYSVDNKEEIERFSCEKMTLELTVDTIPIDILEYKSKEGVPPKYDYARVDKDYGKASDVAKLIFNSILDDLKFEMKYGYKPKSYNFPFSKDTIGKVILHKGLITYNDDIIIDDSAISWKRYSPIKNINSSKTKEDKIFVNCDFFNYEKKVLLILKDNSECDNCPLEGWFSIYAKLGDQTVLVEKIKLKYIDDEPRFVKLYQWDGLSYGISFEDKHNLYDIEDSIKLSDDLHGVWELHLTPAASKLNIVFEDINRIESDSEDETKSINSIRFIDEKKGIYQEVNINNTHSISKRGFPFVLRLTENDSKIWEIVKKKPWHNKRKVEPDDHVKIGLKDITGKPFVIPVQRKGVKQDVRIKLDDAPDNTYVYYDYINYHEKNQKMYYDSTNTGTINITLWLPYKSLVGSRKQAEITINKPVGYDIKRNSSEEASSSPSNLEMELSDSPTTVYFDKLPTYEVIYIDISDLKGSISELVNDVRKLVESINEINGKYLVYLSHSRTPLMAENESELDDLIFEMRMMQNVDPPVGETDFNQLSNKIKRREATNERHLFKFHCLYPDGNESGFETKYKYIIEKICKKYENGRPIDILVYGISSDVKVENHDKWRISYDY